MSPTGNMNLGRACTHLMMLLAMVCLLPLNLQAQSPPSSEDSNFVSARSLTDLKLPLKDLNLSLSEDGLQAEGTLAGAAKALKRIECRSCSLKERREGVERFQASAAQWLKTIEDIADQRGWELLRRRPGPIQWGDDHFTLLPPGGTSPVEIHLDWGDPTVFDDGEISLDDTAGQVRMVLAPNRKGKRAPHAFPVSLEGPIPEGYFREDGSTGVLFRREQTWGPTYHQAPSRRQQINLLRNGPKYLPSDHGYQEVCTRGLGKGSKVWKRGDLYVEDRRRDSGNQTYALRFFETSQDPDWVARHIADPTSPRVVDKGAIIYRGRLFPAPLRLTEDRQFIYHDGQPVFWKGAPRSRQWKACPHGDGPSPDMATLVEALKADRLLVFRGTEADRPWLKEGSFMGSATLLSKVERSLRSKHGPSKQLAQLRALEWWPLRPSDGAFREFILWNALPSDQIEPPIADPLTRPEDGILGGLTLYPAEAARLALSLGLPTVLVSRDINDLSEGLAKSMYYREESPSMRFMDRYVDLLNASLKALKQEGWEEGPHVRRGRRHSPEHLSLNRLMTDRVVRIFVTYPYADSHFGNPFEEESDVLGLYHYRFQESPRMALDLGLPLSPEETRLLEGKGGPPLSLDSHIPWTELALYGWSPQCSANPRAPQGALANGQYLLIDSQLYLPGSGQELRRMLAEPGSREVLIRRGAVILGGAYLPGPYRLRQEGDELSLNGHALGGRSKAEPSIRYVGGRGTPGREALYSSCPQAQERLRVYEDVRDALEADYVILISSDGQLLRPYQGWTTIRSPSRAVGRLGGSPPPSIPAAPIPRDESLNRVNGYVALLRSESMELYNAKWIEFYGFIPGEASEELKANWEPWQ